MTWEDRGERKLGHSGEAASTFKERSWRYPEGKEIPQRGGDHAACLNPAQALDENQATTEDIAPPSTQGPENTVRWLVRGVGLAKPSKQAHLVFSRLQASKAARLWEVRSELSTELPGARVLLEEAKGC